MIRLCFVKCGNIATSTVVDLLLDEIASREELEMTVLGSGPKMAPDDTERIGRLVPPLDPDLVILCGPNAASPGMARLRETLADIKAVKIVIGDGPSKKVRDKLEQEGYGYLIMEADPLIGARREFLDPTEMALFNADVLKVLAAVGSLRLVHEELDRSIASIKTTQVYLPRIIVSESASLARAGFSNPYARAKAAAAFQLACTAAQMNYRACFVEKQMKKYIRLAAAAHEAIRAAARLADEAREIEKGSDKVLRTPHSRAGALLKKRSLMNKPKEETL